MSKLLQGKIVVFTGALSMPRAQAKMMAERSGAIVTSTVTQATNVIVAGPGAGSKLAVAAAKGIETWTEQEFFQRMTREDHQGRLGDNSGQILEVGKGSFQFSLAWDALVDLDVHLICPNKKEVFFCNRQENNCELDVDRMPNGKKWTIMPVENIICKSIKLPGRYKCTVHYYSGSAKNVDYTVHCRLGDSVDEIVTASFPKYTDGAAHDVCEFDVDKSGNITVVKMAKSVLPGAGNNADEEKPTKAKKAVEPKTAGKKTTAKKPAAKAAKKPAAKAAKKPAAKAAKKPAAKAAKKPAAKKAAPKRAAATKTAGKKK
jgi:hypothetical protein